MFQSDVYGEQYQAVFQFYVSNIPHITGPDLLSFPAPFAMFRHIHDPVRFPAWNPTACWPACCAYRIDRVMSGLGIQGDCTAFLVESPFFNNFSNNGT